MPRRYDEDGQPMMSNSQMLKRLVDEMPVMYRDLRGQIQDLKTELKGDIARLDTKIDGVAADLKQLSFKVDQNHLCLMTNQEDMEKRIAVLEAA